MIKRTITIGLAVAALGAGIGACGGSDEEPAASSAAKDAPAAATSVAIGDNTFTPATIEVKTGETVTFENRGAIPHTVTGDGFDSGSMAPGDTFAFKAEKAGSVSYVCSFHPGMQGTIEVS